jgi:hypothetical protein
MLDYGEKEMTVDVEVPPAQIYTHSLKVEDTQKGVRFTVHVYANSTDVAIDQAFALYDGALKRAAKLSIPMADIPNGNNNGVMKK